MRHYWVLQQGLHRHLLDELKISLHLLKRDQITQKFFELETTPLNVNPYHTLKENMQNNSKFGLIPKIDAEFIANMHYKKKSNSSIIKD